MTNPTPTENERIALLRGWQYITPVNTPPVWVSLTGEFLSDGGCPDFLHEWEHAGPLLEELWNSSELYWLSHKWISLMELVRYYYERGHDLLVAISRAWLAWQEEERDDGAD